MKNRIFWILCIVGGIAIFSSTIAKNPVLPILAQQIGADKATIGFIAAASTITGILASLPAGLLSDRRGRKPVLILSGIVFFTAPFLYLLVKTPIHLALVRVFHGFATAVFGPVAMATIADLSTEKRGERLGYFSSAQLVGRSAAPVLGGLLLTVSVWQNVYVACAIAGGLTLLGILILPHLPKVKDELPQPTKTEKAANNLFDVIRHRGILLTSMARAAQYFTFGAIEAFLPLYALSVGINQAVVGVIFGVQVGMRTLTRPLTGVFSDQKGRKLPIMLGLGIVAISVALFTLTKTWWVMLIISIFYGIGFSLASGSTSAFVADLAPDVLRGSAMGLMSAIMDIGQALGPILLGFLLLVTSYQVGFLVIAILVVLVIGLFSILVMEARPASKKNNEVKI